jgi:hypothetical protein
MEAATTEEVRKLRQSVQAVIQMQASMVDLLAKNGVLTWQDVTFQASLIEPAVIDSQLHDQWRTAFRRT